MAGAKPSAKEVVPQLLMHDWLGIVVVGLISRMGAQHWVLLGFLLHYPLRNN